MFYIPALRDLLAKETISVGGLGIFLILSYAAGQLIAAVGNLIEGIYWRLRGGMPSGWVIGPKPRLLNPSQISRLQAAVAQNLGLELPTLSELTGTAWFPIFRQIYSYTETNGKPARAEAFNGNYGLNRGLGVSTLALSLIAIASDPYHWAIALGLFIASLTYLYRMHRFGVHYAREVYSQFLSISSGPPAMPRADSPAMASRDPSQSD